MSAPYWRNAHRGANGSVWIAGHESASRQEAIAYAAPFLCPLAYLIKVTPKPTAACAADASQVPGIDQ